MNRLIVHQPGLFTTVQDLGRTGFRSLGVPRGGAMDRHAFRLANLLVGNHEAAGALECTLAGPDISFGVDTWIAVCGAEIDGIRPASPMHVPAGRQVSLRRFQKGCRAYLAIAGGLELPSVLDGLSTYTRGGFGGLEGRCLRTGDQISVGDSRTSYPDIEHWHVTPDLLSRLRDPAVVRFLEGPQWDWISAEGQRTMESEAFRVLPQSDRMGLRLGGPVIARSKTGEMTSEAVCEGAIQIPPDGQPIVLMADCQTIGGYPKFAHVISVDLPILAQLSPGAAVHFRKCTLDEAEKALLDEEATLAKLREGLVLKRS